MELRYSFCWAGGEKGEGFLIQEITKNNKSIKTEDTSLKKKTICFWKSFRTSWGLRKLTIYAFDL